MLLLVSYSVNAGESGMTVGCVIRLAPEQSLNRDDIEVSRVEQLDSSLTLAVNEELLSNIISINLVVQQVCFNNNIICWSVISRSHGQRPRPRTSVPVLSPTRYSSTGTA